MMDEAAAAERVREELRRLLKARGVTKVAVSLAIPMNKHYVQQFLRAGVPYTLSPDKSEKIADILDCDPKLLDVRYWRDPEQYERGRVERSKLFLEGGQQTYFDGELLASCTRGFEEALERLGLQATPTIRAHVIPRLYQYMSATNVPLNDEVFELIASLVAKKKEPV